MSPDSIPANILFSNYCIRIFYYPKYLCGYSIENAEKVKSAFLKQIRMSLFPPAKVFLFTQTRFSLLLNILIYHQVKQKAAIIHC